MNTIKIFIQLFNFTQDGAQKVLPEICKLFRKNQDDVCPYYPGTKTLLSDVIMTIIPLDSLHLIHPDTANQPYVLVLGPASNEMRELIDTLTSIDALVGIPVAYTSVSVSVCVKKPVESWEH